MSEDTRTANIFKSNKKGRYSNLSYGKVLEYIGIDNRTVFEEISNAPMKEIDNEVIEQISKSLIGLTKAYGMVDEGNEYKRQEFVSTIIFKIVEQYYDKGVKLKREKQIEGEDIKGPVEFVIVRGKLILIVIEAKKQDWDQGRAQILTQLYNTYTENIKLGAPKNHVIYGILTTGYTWEFIWCEGNNVVYWIYQELVENYSILLGMITAGYGEH
ncbi:hypothetical protein BJ944DRAFT_237507 [Cunninghamella echinulata]|nr:hypothetical protein BJ944DRAFT_237507 [Cunninghamella echinulata]